jgi:predicted HTH transcriptional regulator
VHRTVVPSPDVTVEDHQVDGKTILVLHVAPGSAPPYGIAADKGSRDKPEFYVRRGSSTYPAQPGEPREAARTRPAQRESRPPDPVRSLASVRTASPFGAAREGGL